MYIEFSFISKHTFCIFPIRSNNFHFNRRIAMYLDVSICMFSIVLFYKNNSFMVYKHMEILKVKC